MKLTITKTKLWRLARDCGVIVPLMKQTELLAYRPQIAKLRWKRGECILSLWEWGAELQIFWADGSIERKTLDLDELRKRDMIN